MTKITESIIEKFAIELLEKEGFQYIFVPPITPNSDTLLPKLMRGKMRVRLVQGEAAT